MKIKDVFFPKTGQKVTEKYLRKVLVTSICGILLCMSCLAGTTWAWYVVSIENIDNEIFIAETVPDVAVTVNGSSIPSGDLNSPNLSKGNHLVEIVHSGAVDDVQQKSKLYVTFSIDEVVRGYVTLNKDNGYRTSIEIIAEENCFISWTVSWFTPNGASPLASNKIELITEEEPEPTEDPTEEATEDPSASTEGETQPNQTEGEATEETTEPATKPTDAQTDPTEETVQPTEDTTEQTESETNTNEEPVPAEVD